MSARVNDRRGLVRVRLETGGSTRMRGDSMKFGYLALDEAAEKVIQAIRDHAAAVATADIDTLRLLARKVHDASLDYSAAVAKAGSGIDPFDEEALEADVEAARGNGVFVEATYDLRVVDEARLIAHANDQLARAGAPYTVDDPVQAVEELYRLQLWDPGVPEALRVVDFSSSVSEDDDE
jgi:hypothetical protein